MYEGIKADGKIDSDFEFNWFLGTLRLECDENKIVLENVLRNTFYGVMRLVHGYAWLKECPKGIDVSNIKIEVRLEQNENGKFENEILGRWEMTISCGEGKTTENTMRTIIRVMEQFVRARFNADEPKGLEALALEYKRNSLINDHFVGLVKSN